ncbi:hypothetical protein acdb102_02170 [Acidothermaceae bacterium B102]|nr:hypothetical protein acdb102_02170 [Acidothermaceae bacterium B102]
MASGWSIRRTCVWWLPTVAVVAAVSHLPWLYHRLYLGPAAPLAGMLRLRLNLGFLAAVLLAATVVRWGAVVATRLAWPVLLVLSSLTASVWAALLALNDGFSVLAGHIAAPYQVWNDLPSLHRLGVHRFLRSYVRDLPDYAVHSQGHPPGAILVMEGFHQLGFSAAGATAALDIVAGGSAVAAVAVAVRLLSGELLARRSLPFLVLAPAAIWVATTMDALFMGVCAWAIALVALAVRWSGVRRVLATAGSTVLCASALMLSYGLLPLGLLMAVVLVGGRRRVVTAVCVGIGTSVLLALVGLTGFSWLSGFAATHHAYVTTVASVRPYLYFLVADLVVLSVMVGPAVLGGLRVLDRRLWPLVGATVVVLAFLDLSGYTKGEVERIWLPFAVWLLPAAASLPLARHRSWLTAQAVTALVLQAFLVSLW